MEKNKIAIYESENSIQLEVLLENENIWLTQAQMVQLFERDQSVISRHIRNIFKEGELDKEVVYANFAYTTQHGAIKGKTQTRDVEYYSLDVIISVGYRIKSKKGTEFRQWATQILKKYLIEGYVVNEKRLKERNIELATHLQTLSLAFINKIPLTNETVMKMLIPQK
jgi:hypothetical protein